MSVPLAGGIERRFGRAWAYRSPRNQALNLDHRDDPIIRTRYRPLRAMRKFMQTVRPERGRAANMPPPQPSNPTGLKKWSLR